MKFRRIGRVAAALAAGGGLTAGALVLSSTSAAAASDNYGPGAVYQVEISANAPDGAFWVWAALYPSSPGANHGTVDYEETDCIHLPHIATAAANDAGDGTWAIVGNTLQLYGVNIIGNAEVAEFDVPLPASGTTGHSSGLTVMVTGANISPLPAGLPPVGAQFVFDATPQSQNQIAP